VTSVPLHPALVHIPLGLAFILPALAAGLTWAIWKGQVRPKAWAVIVVLLAILLGAGLVALKTGQKEEERVERTVPEAAIATHEAYAEQFLWVTGVTLAVSGLALVLRRPLPVRALTAGTVLGTFLITGAALRVGHAGGQLVYVHNGAAAYASAGKGASEVLNQTGGEAQKQSLTLPDSDR
jgi:uncharacterized membrane protein